MTQREFALKLFKAIGVTYINSFETYSDKHVDGTKVLRIKTIWNPSGHSSEECQNILTNYLADVAGISKVTVRSCNDVFSGLNWCIQVEYKGQLLDLNNPTTISPEPEAIPTPEPEVSESVTEGGLIKVETPFGIGYATDEVDKARMMLWLEGVKAGMAYVKASQDMDQVIPEPEDTESPDPEADFDLALNSIVAERMSDWWVAAERIRDEYETIDDVTASDLMSNAFDEWFHSQE